MIRPVRFRRTTYRRLGMLLCCLGVPVWLAAITVQSDENDETPFYRRWLNQEVRYIIGDAEKEVFEGLSTNAERERFIEQFWHRRDPDPRTPINEYREEHYRRIAYANERFQSGVSGWKTDRGRIYILYGPPDEMESYPSGGRYLRGPFEGGGSSASYPFELWRYRFIPALGPNIEMEFVDPTWAGQYQLAAAGDEKDALIRVPNAGLTRTERMGLTRKMDRPFFQPGMRQTSRLGGELAKDSPFARYERKTLLMSPLSSSDPDLRERVEVGFSYHRFDHQVRSDQFPLNHGKALVAITLALENQDFSFIREGDHQTTRLSIYGSLTDISHHLVEEFEEEVMLAYAENDRASVLSSRSLYQHILILEQGGRYRLDLVIKDLNSGRIGSVRTGVHAARYDDHDLAASSLLLSDWIEPLPRDPGGDRMFVIRDIKVRPSVDNRFLADNPLGLYLQLHNLGFDQTDGKPWLETRYRIHRDGELIMESSGGADEGLRIYPDGRVALIKDLTAFHLVPGRYRLEVQLSDRIKRESVDLQQEFELIAARTGNSDWD